MVGPPADPDSNLQYKYGPRSGRLFYQFTLYIKFLILLLMKTSGNLKETNAADPDSDLQYKYLVDFSISFLYKQKGSPPLGTISLGLTVLFNDGISGNLRKPPETGCGGFRTKVWKVWMCLLARQAEHLETEITPA